MIKHGFSLNRGTVLLGLGFGLTLVWCLLASHTLGFVSSARGLEDFFNPRMFYLLGILLFALLYIGAPQAIRRAEGALRYCVPLLSSFGTVCFGLASHQTFFDATILAVGGLFLVGVGYLWFLARYILVLARTQSFSNAVWAVVIGLIVKLPIVAVLSLLVSPELQVAIAMLLPLVSAGIFEMACRILRKDTKDATSLPAKKSAKQEARMVFRIPVRKREAAPTSQTFRRNVFVLLAVSAILLAVIRSVSVLGIWGNNEGAMPLSVTWLIGFGVSVIALSLFAYFMVICMRDFALAVRFQPAMLFALAGLFVVALQSSPSSEVLPFLTEVIQIDELCAHVLFWAVIITALNALSTPSYRVIGIAEAVFAAASILWMLFLGSSAIINNMYVLLVVYLVVVVALYATWLGGKSRAGEGLNDLLVAEFSGAPLAQKQEGVSLSHAVHGTCMEMAQRYGLSPRETEVFILLAQGRTQSFIQDQLVIAGSTVKTHVNHIYTKLDVRDRQEMMDLIWK